MHAIGPEKKYCIATGGTGGHLFPALALAEGMVERGHDVTILQSWQKGQGRIETDQEFRVISLPGSGENRAPWNRLKAFWQSFQLANECFAADQPVAVIGMGGLASLPPLLAAMRLGIPIFLHDSNAIPGKVNRWLSGRAAATFIAFESAARFVRGRSVLTGTPVRNSLQQLDVQASRLALGLKPERPVLLITGGSQGASPLNQLFLSLVEGLVQKIPDLQFLHLTGEKDFSAVQAFYQTKKLAAVVHPFLTEMEYGFSAATVALSRAGGSTIAELRKFKLPALLVPYPAAADNHQYFNALELATSGEAVMVQQHEPAAAFTEALLGLFNDSHRQKAVQAMERTPGDPIDLILRGLFCGEKNSQTRLVQTPLIMHQC